MSDTSRWLLVVSGKTPFKDINEAAIGFSRNVTTENIQQMLDNDVPIPKDWYRYSGKEFEITDGFDNILRAVRIIEYETDFKTYWLDIVKNILKSMN